MSKWAEKISIIALNNSGISIAKKITEQYPTSQLFVPKAIVQNDEIAFDEISPLLQNLFLSGHTIIGLCSAGILIRALTPVIFDKYSEPPVLAISIDNKYVIPLLGGHRGANQASNEIASMLDGLAILTTASEAFMGFSLDDPPKGWKPSKDSKIKQISSAIFNGLPVQLNIEAGGGDWIENAYQWNPNAKLKVTLSDKLNAVGDVILRPFTITVGVGCERGANPELLIDLTEKMLKEYNISLDSVACIASLDLKADEKAVRELSYYLDVPIRLFNAEQLEAETPRLINPSTTVYKAVGCHGVAESAALAAAGYKSSLIAPKEKNSKVTCAIAKSPTVIDTNNIGKGLGCLTIVGIGPGTKDWITPAVNRVIIQSRHLVGYKGYLKLLGDLGKHAFKHPFELGAETERARKALELAANGDDTALICSGDAGIYGMASLVFELLDQSREEKWRFIEVIVEPGVSAMQAAAAKVGAPLGHDFCAISLSDLLTPWDVIEKRLYSASRSGFVIALYNPASRDRRQPLEKALKIICNQRSLDCPVIVARCLGRKGEKIQTVSLKTLELTKIDMLTVIIIGNNETRITNHGGKTFTYTPRGYKNKYLESK